MQIIEVRNDILKLAYSPFQNGLLLSDFLLVSEGSKSILAQVIGIESSNEKDINIAVLKGCLSVDETGKINSYVGFTPSTGAEITPVAQEQVISMVAGEQNTVFWGYLAQHDTTMFKTEFEFVKNKPLILMDDYNNYNVIVNNLVHTTKQFGGKAVIVDFDGNLQVDNAFYIKTAEDFKFPLSYNTLNYIYENDLKEESLSTQAVVQDIIIELQEYIKALPEGFLPFSTIKNVVYSQYEENKIPELMLFKNKFLKYAQQDFLAETTEDFDFINEAINENNIVIIDASNLDTTWHKLMLNYLSSELSEKAFFITKLENDNSDKKTILDIYNNREIMPILTSGHSHECINVLKSIAKNLIVFQPNKVVNDYGTHASFMQKLNRDEYVICGENTLYLSFIVRLTYIDTNMSPEYIEKEIQADVDKLYRAGSKKTASTIAPTQNILANEPVVPVSPQVSATQNTAHEDEMITDDDLDFLEELDDMPEETEEIGLDSFTNTEHSENIYENPEEYKDEEDEEEAYSPLEVKNVSEELEIQTLPTYEENAEYKSEPEEEPEDDDVIDDTPKTPPIPIYSVPELETESPAEFVEGNFVYHEKYGKGVIEKIMNYGTKTLCSIQFEEVGRRLLDPNLAGLKQV